MTDSGSALRFLVVDDDDDVRDALVHMVTRLGHTAVEGSDGVEAIAALVVDRYDVMLLDLAMPRMPGEDVMRWLKDHPRWAAGLRVVVVTALVGDHRKRLEALGASAILAKPIRTEQLRGRIEESHGTHAPWRRRPA